MFGRSGRLLAGALAAASVGAAAGFAAAEPPPGGAFRDCPECPEMVAIPPGSYTMGTPDTDKDSFGDEGPPTKIALAKPFALGKFEVTFAEWDACVAARGCRHRPKDQGWGRGRMPAMNVSWNDTQSYLGWLRRKTGKAYRLPSEAEWEYAARAGATGRFSWGEAPGPNRANCQNCGSAGAGKQTMPVGSFAANKFGLHDMHGNVWEWTQDCWAWTLAGTPANGRPRLRGTCGERVVRGGSYLVPWTVIRSSRRDRNAIGIRADQYGFRAARPM